MTQTLFLCVLVSVIVAAGMLGGVLNYFLQRKDDPDGRSIGKSLTLGIGASFLVPLFLNMISSNLTEQIRGSAGTTADLPKILVFAGFCLVAAISSTAFIQTLSDRVLKEAQEAKKTAREAEKKATDAQSLLEPLLQKETERDSANTVSVSVLTLDPNQMQLLKELAAGEWVLRTRTSLSKRTQLPKDQVDLMMDDLKKQGLVGSKIILGTFGEKKRRWYITNQGREAIT
jgi:hypothetical protein